MDTERYADSKRPLGDFRAVPQEKVVEVMRKDAEGWMEVLSEEEKRVIRKYTYNSGDKMPNRFFERLNAMLRGDFSEDASLLNYAEIISSAIKKNKFKYDVICYRGMDIDPTLGASRGDLIKPRQFYSTSVIEKRSFGSKYKIIIYVKKGSMAAYIEELSCFKKQRELLLDKDCIYRVLSKRGNVIELEVI